MKISTECSSRDTFAFNESLQHPTIAVLLKKILIFFFDHSIVFTCSKVINSFKRQNSWTDTFQKSSKNLIFPELSSHNIPQFSRSPQGTPGTMTPFCVIPKYEEERVADYEARLKSVMIVHSSNSSSVKFAVNCIKYSKNLHSFTFCFNKDDLQASCRPISSCLELFKITSYISLV